MSNKKLLFSLTKKDFEFQTFCTGGPGGQNQNRRQAGVRIIHRDSGAVGEGREFREQARNKEAAFKRLTETKEFKNWLKVKVSFTNQQLREVEAAVEEAMRDENLKVEYF